MRTASSQTCRHWAGDGLLVCISMSICFHLVSILVRTAKSTKILDVVTIKKKNKKKPPNKNKHKMVVHNGRRFLLSPPGHSGNGSSGKDQWQHFRGGDWNIQTCHGFRWTLQKWSALMAPALRTEQAFPVSPSSLYRWHTSFHFINTRPKCVCVYVRERVHVCFCAYSWERDRESVCMCVCSKWAYIIYSYGNTVIKQNKTKNVQSCPQIAVHFSHNTKNRHFPPITKSSFALKMNTLLTQVLISSQSAGNFPLIIVTLFSKALAPHTNNSWLLSE